MNVAELRQATVILAKQYFPQAELAIEERHGVQVHLRVLVDEATFISVYYSSLTEKKSFALVQKDNRVFGYDNLRGWHKHPVENPGEHVVCAEPTPDQVFSEISNILNRKYGGLNDRARRNVPSRQT